MGWLGPIAAVALTILIVGTPIAIWVECRTALENRRFRRTLARRESLTDAEFVAAFYNDNVIPIDIPLRLRPIYGKYFELDPSKIRPSDLPPDIYAFDTEPLVDAIEREFGITIDDAEHERTTSEFDAIVNCIFRISRKHDTMALGS